MKRKRNPLLGLFSALYETGIGYGAVVAGKSGLIEVKLPFAASNRAAVEGWLALSYPHARTADPVAAEAAALLGSYFSGQRVKFELPLDLGDATPFQREVCREVSAIPYGTVLSYGEVACRIGRPGAARGVGGAMAGNPFAIVVPCHRVVGSSGALTGYSGEGGIVSKKWLLEMEGVVFRGMNRVCGAKQAN